ncbi:hypothetical protein Dsin_017304 [Dipteronia sinensis]|uniref:Uncharacterized protein n=1 Tax=Dipteronia sinensis TaxID=43782 RepID=A0AAE0AFH2_9ROSI|nr:hypothetical protein Dsin_017304 [Dipteronia sinensis]
MENRKEYFSRIFEGVKTTIRDQETRLQNLQSISFQLANYYFVFQGIIFTAICNGTTSLKCQDRWFLFTISLLAALLNLVALATIGLKYINTMDEQDRNWIEAHEIETILLEGDKHASGIPYKDPCKRIKWYIVYICCMLCFSAFAVVTLYGSWNFLCRHDEFKKTQSYQKESYNHECIKFCNGGRENETLLKPQQKV